MRTLFELLGIVVICWLVALFQVTWWETWRRRK